MWFLLHKIVIGQLRIARPLAKMGAGVFNSRESLEAWFSKIFSQECRQ